LQDPANVSSKVDCQLGSFACDPLDHGAEEERKPFRDLALQNGDASRSTGHLYGSLLQRVCARIAPVPLRKGGHRLNKDAAPIWLLKRSAKQARKHVYGNCADCSSRLAFCGPSSDASATVAVATT